VAAAEVLAADWEEAAASVAAARVVAGSVCAWYEEHPEHT
jgi:hypothetical protein